MTTQKIPGTWESIPKGAVVTATWGDQTVKGTLESIIGTHRDKRMELRAAPFGIIKLDVRDGWEVTYESYSAGDVIRSAPIGAVWGTQMTFYPRTVKISDTHVSRQHEQREEPVILPVSNYDSWDADAIKFVHPADLARLAENR